MTGQAEVRNSNEDAGSGDRAVSDVGDPLRSLRLVKWLTRLFVYPGVTLLMPLDHFLSGLTWEHAISVHLGGYVIATIAIELAFGQAFRLRKLSAYPNVLLMQLEGAQTVDSAARQALSVLHQLLGLRASFIALDEADASPRLASVSGMNWGDAESLLRAGTHSIGLAMRSHEVASWDAGRGGPTEEAARGSGERLLVIPIVALQQPIGVLAVAGARWNGELRDGQLMSNLGVALGLSLENLRQKVELRESEARLRVMVEQMPAVLWTTDRELKFTSSLGAGLAELGLRPNQVVGMTLSEYFQTEDPDFEPIAAHRRALTGEAATYQAEWMERAFDCHVEPLRDAEGEPIGCIGVAMDISEGKQAEETLHRREEEFRALAENAPDIIARFDRELRHVYVNPAVERVLRLSPQEIIGKAHPELGMPEELYSYWQAALRKVFETGEESVIEFATPGGAKSYQSRLVPEFSGDGTLEFVLTITRDITEHKHAEEALRESETHFRTLAETSAAAAFIYQGTKMRYVSSAAEAITGYTRDELLAMDFWDVIHPDSREMVKERGLARQRGEDVPQRYEVKVLTKSGEERWVEFTANAIDFEGKPAVLGTAFDITERKEAEGILRESEERFRQVFEEGPIGMAIVSADFRLVRVNEALCRMLGYTKQELTGKVFAEITHPEDVETDLEQAERVFRGEIGAYQIEKRYLRKDGEVVWGNLTASVVRDQDGTPLYGLGTVENISERKQAEKTIRHLAYHDALTGLPNRILFQDRLTVALAQARRKAQVAAVMFLDLDQFKVVNDTVGHALGDVLLQSVAERLVGLVRDGDTVARVGGDEFTLLLPEADRTEDVVDVAERILEALRRPWTVNGQEFHVTTSIGIATFPHDGEDAESLLRNADTAMYRAKDQGRDNYKLYTPTMNARIAERLALENSLRRGLERGEFVVYYQPQVNIGSGRIVGMEALVRWQHPERGLVSPAEFIPLAEETGLIVPLDAWVLRTACEQNKAWQDDGLFPMRVAVNLSARQFQLRNLIDTIAQVLGETGVDARQLQVEITEGVAMQDVEFTVAMLRQLREMGVQIAIDDFGTGHSSLSYLKRFPIDVVKIDQSFVRDLTFDPNDAAIASAIVVMAHNLKLKVIAEGVETEEQMAFLRRWNCDEMQGYLFSEPAPAEAFAEMLRRDGRRSRARRPVRSDG